MKSAAEPKSWSQFRRLVHGSGLLMASEAFNQICGFVRNIILARTLTKADFGLAATFGIITSLLEISGKLAFGSKVVQAAHDDEKKLLDNLHTFQLACSAFSALLMFALAWPLAEMLKEPQLRLALCVLAVSVGAEGFRNLSIFVHVKRLRYGRVIMADALPQLLMTLVAYPLCLWLKDYNVILWLVVGKAVIGVALSHFLAEDKFNCRPSRNMMWEIFKFGFPLYISGLIFALNAQGERALVVAFYNLSDLGTYAVAVSLVYAPGYALCRIAASLGLPILAKSQNSPVQFRREYRLFAQSLCLFGTFFALGFFLLGGFVVNLVFGDRYANASAIIAWLAVGFGIRLANVAATVTAMARGDTVNLLAANVYRLGGVVAALIPALLRMDLQWIAAAGALFELVSMAGSSLGLRRRHGIPIGNNVWMNVFSFSLVGLCIMLGQAWAAQPLIKFGLPMLLIVTLVLLLRYARALSELREYLSPLIARALKKMRVQETPVT